MLEVVKGDLISAFKEKKIDLMIHGCNCFHTMGAGIALSIKKAFPQVVEADLNTPIGDRSKMGTCSFAEIDGGGVIVNAYTQFNFGKAKAGRILFDYNAFRDCLFEIKSLYGGRGLKFGFPKIGCGLAGAEYELVEEILEEEMGGEEVFIYIID